MDPVSSALISKSLDGLAMRSAIISQNIANSNTPNYQPMKVSFEDALKAAEQDVDAINAVQPKIEMVSIDDNGGQLRLDLEMASASSTAGRYAALIDVLSRQMEISLLSVKGGR